MTNAAPYILIALIALAGIVWVSVKLWRMKDEY